MGDRPVPAVQAASSSAWRWPAPWCSTRSWVLMDEPLGALDKQLREHMQIELKALHRQLWPDLRLRHARPVRGADHVGPGRRLQRGRDPADRQRRRSYETPANRFVAGFVGDNRCSRRGS